MSGSARRFRCAPGLRVLGAASGPRLRPLRTAISRSPAPTLAALGGLVVWRAATPRAAALQGFAFGLGLLLAGVSWVYVSLHRQFGGMPAPARRPGGLPVLPACLALFPALAGYALRTLAQGSPASRRAARLPRRGRCRSGCAAGCSPASPGWPSAIRKARPARWPAGRSLLGVYGVGFAAALIAVSC
jgi:apolipoprotein N-acyltransferase